MLIYPFTDMGTAGYTSTTINYILPFFCMLYSFYIVDKSLHHKSIKIVEYILSLIATIVCCNMEQSCAVFFGFIFIIVLKQFVEDTNRKMFFKKNLYIILLLIISILSLLFIYTCPGNKARSIAEMTRYPEFANFNASDKIYLGIIPTMSILLNQGVVSCLFSFMLMIYTIICSKNNGYKIVSSLLFVFFLMFGPLRQILLQIYPYFSKFFLLIDYTGIYGNRIINITSVLTCLIIMLILFLLWKIFNNKLYFLIFLAGFLSRVMMGFSPTIFASSTRTMLYLDFSMIILTFILFKEIDDSKIIKKKINYIFYVVVIISVFTFFNTLYGMM